MIEGRFGEAIEVADVILKYFPKDVYTILKRGHAHGDLLKTEFLSKYPVAATIPRSLRPRYHLLASENAKAFDKAEKLGWLPPL